MPNFPKINEKFYAAGQRLPSLRAAVERIAAMEAEAEAKPLQMPEDVASRRDAYQNQREDFESKSFSLMIGALDGLLQRR